MGLIISGGSGGGTPNDNTVTSAKIVDGTIVDADINAAAAIAKSKLAALAIANADVAAGAAIAYSKLNLGTSIVNADVAAAAAIASSKLALAAATSGRQSMLAPFDPARLNATGAPGANFVCGSRCEAPISGTLHDLTVYTTTASGNLRVGVYDTGDALAGSRSLLYGSGSVASAGSNAYQVVADPNIAVVAGKHYDLVVFCDNGTVSLGRQTQANAGVNVLPTNFLPAAGGASPKLSWTFALAYAALPSTITEANCGAASNIVWVGGRIS